jgi:hypothetical protein
VCVCLCVYVCVRVQVCEWDRSAYPCCLTKHYIECLVGIFKSQGYTELRQIVGVSGGTNPLY